MQPGDAGGVKSEEAKQASSLLTLPSRRGYDTTRGRQGLGRSLSPSSLAAGQFGSSRGRSGLRQRPPNSTRLQGRLNGRTSPGIPMAVPWERTPSEP